MFRAATVRSRSMAAVLAAGVASVPGTSVSTSSS